MFIRNTTLRNRIGLAAASFLALVSLGCAVYSTATLHYLLTEGVKTDAVVAGIHSGTKGSKRAVLEFTDQQGRPVKTRDYCQFFLVRPDRGEQVTVIYDPENPQTATIDLGIWTWQQPVAFYLGFLFLAGLGALIFRFGNRNHASAEPGRFRLD